MTETMIYRQRDLSREPRDLGFQDIVGRRTSIVGKYNLEKSQKIAWVVLELDKMVLELE